MVRRPETDPIDRDERLGEAIEVFLSEAEAGPQPDPDEFAGRYPDLSDDLRAALEGLALVRGLVGEPGHRLESGRRIAGYRIVRELGRGGMGTVYEAVHVGLDRPVALKVLGTSAAPDSNGRRRFLNEARTAAGLHHTHIVPVFDVGQVGGLCYYAMQRIEGSGLDRVLRHLRRDRSPSAGSLAGRTTPPGGRPSWTNRAFWRPGFSSVAPARGSEDDTASWLGGNGVAGAAQDHDDEPPPFDPPRGSAYDRWVAEVGRQAAEALAHAHRRGIIHRDIKPSNLLVDARGMIWVADFGLARRLADPGLTQHDSLLGTPRYMSPEQARTGPIDGRTDVYSLGATLFELLTLRPPFDGQSTAELVAQIANHEPPAPRSIDSRIPRDLETIVLKALSKRAEDRYATAAELAEDLARFLRLEPVRARRIGPLGRIWRLARRHPGMAIVSTAAAAAVLAVATVAYVRVVHERDQKEIALRSAQAANRDTQAAMLAQQAAMRTQLWREASMVRLSNVPNRRATGLGLLKEASALDPEPALRAKIRDEAAAFLVVRDVEARPEFQTGPVLGITFGPEGTRLATLSEDGGMFALWDVASRRRLEQYRITAVDLGDASNLPPIRPGPSTSRLAGPGATMLAALGHCVAAVRPDGQGLRLFDIATGVPIRDLAMPGRRILSVMAVPGSHRLVTIEVAAAEGQPYGEYRVSLYDPEHVDTALATLARWEVSSSGRDFPLVAIGPEGGMIATGRVRDTAVAFWEPETGRSVGTMETQAELTALALGPDGLLATAGAGTIRLWDVMSKASLPGLSPFQSVVRILRFNPTGTLLAVAGTGADVELWDPATHTAVAVLPLPDRPVDLAFAPDGRTLAAAGPAATTSVWTVVDPLVRTQISGFDAMPTSLSFRDDDLLAMGSWRGTVRFWNPGRCPSSTQTILGGSDASSSTAADTSYGDKPTTLAFDDQGRLVTIDPDSLRCWGRDSLKCGFHHSRRGGGPSRTALPVIAGGWWRMYPLAVDRVREGRTLFLARGDQILAWNSNLSDRWQSLELPPPASPPATDRAKQEPIIWRSLAASPTVDRLYLIDHTGTVHVLGLEGRKTRLLNWTLPGAATCLAVSPDGATLALGDRQGNVTLIETAHGTQPATRLHSPGNEVEGRTWTLAFAPNGRELAVGTQQGSVEIWSLSDTSTPELRLPGHRGYVTTLAYGHDGHYLASGGSDKLVEVWDLAKVREELTHLGLAW